MKKNFQNMSDEDVYYLLYDEKSKREAFDELYSRYSSKIYTYCRKVLNNEPAADDIFQETFTRFYESSLVDREMTNVAGFLIKIARNLCLNEKDKKYNKQVSIEDFQFQVNDKSFEKKELNDILNMGLILLPEKYREVLILKEFLDFSYQEIADTLGESLSVIRIRIYRAKAKLREVLSPYFEEYKNNKLDKDHE